MEVFKETNKRANEKIERERKKMMGDLKPEGGGRKKRGGDKFSGLFFNKKRGGDINNNKIRNYTNSFKKE